MSHLDKVVDNVVESRVAPFVVGIVADRHGIQWEHSSGRANSSHTADHDTVFRWFSMTKGIGSLMAVIAIDRGLVTLDAPVGDVLPAFDELQVLEAVTASGPCYRKPKTRATLRHLLTHTAGQGYEAFYPLMNEYAKATGAPGDLTGTLASLNYPLLFDPGASFAYGISTDWVGALVSELDGRPVDRFVREEILEPLGMKDTHFERTGASSQIADLVLKRPDGTFEEVSLNPPASPEIYHMGHALLGSAADYISFLRLVLNHGMFDGRRIVSPEAMQILLEDQLAGVKLPTPLLKSCEPAISNDVEICPGIPKTHTGGFFRTEAEVPGMRSAGSLMWAGVLNTHYWIDPTRDIAAVFMTQMLPFCDPDFMASYEDFERAVYEEFGR